MNIEESGKEYMDNHWKLLTDFEKYAVRESYEMGIKSDAAKEYWFEKFKAQKPIDKIELRYYKELFDDLLTILNERRNKYALQGAHEWKLEGFDLAVKVVKSVLLDEQPIQKPITDEFLNWLDEVITWNKNNTYGTGEDDVQFKLLEQVKEKYKGFKSALQLNK